MNQLALFLSIALCFIGLYLLYILTRVSKRISDKNYNHDRTDIVFMIVVLLLIILIAPYIFTLPIFNCYRDSGGNTGTIGDTIGGITAPFINGIGAILVYLAFKEQVKSSNENRNLEISKSINDRLNWLKNDNYDIVDIENKIKIGFGSRTVIEHPFNKATYLLIEFEDLYNLAQKNTTEKDLLIKQIQYLYRIFYRDRMLEIYEQASSFSNYKGNESNPKLMIVLDFLFAFSSSDKKLRP